MGYNLTENHKNLVRWMVQENRAGNLPDEFSVVRLSGNGFITTCTGDQSDQPELSPGALDALAATDLIIGTPNLRRTTSTRGTSKRPKLDYKETESSRRCTLTAKAYEAVNSDFAAPDISFVTQLTPLADVTSLDDEIKERCLPSLGAGSANQKMWDIAVRTAMVVLEERLRDVGDISDTGRIGQALVNDVFSGRGTLAGRFFIVIVNLLLKMLEELRLPTTA